MAVFRFVLLVCLITFAAAAGLFYFGSLMGYEEFRGGYAVLALDESADDRFIRSLFEEDSGVFGEAVESESAQWVFLDVFDSIQMIPLDAYFSRIFPFDPRYDSYAETLKNIFVRDGKRYFYVPLKTVDWNPKTLDAQFKEILRDIPFTTEYFGIGRPVYFFFIAYAAASFCLLIIYILYRKRSRHSAVFLALIPVFSSLAFFEAAGIACAAVMLAFFVLLKDPLNELISPKKPVTPGSLFKKVLAPFKFQWFFMPVCFLAVLVILHYSQVEIVFLLAVFASGAAVFISSMILMLLARSKHRRFTPVLILKRGYPDLSFSLYALPYAAAAFVVLFFAPFMSASFNTTRQFDAFIGEQDYIEHFNNQAVFSRRQMSTSSVSFPGFFFDADGLPSMTQDADPLTDIYDFPRFPLQDLMDFFHNVNSGYITDSAAPQTGTAGKLSLLVLLLFILPVFFIRRNTGHPVKLDPRNLKRASERETLPGKLRLMGINWNKKLIYNENPLRVKKDA